METWLLAVLTKGFAAFVIFFIVYLIAGLVWRVMPDCRLKRILFAPLPGHRRR